MVSVELLKVTHSINDRVKGADGKMEEVRDDVHDVDNKVQGVDDRVQGIGSDVKYISSEVRCVDGKLVQVNLS
jgi:archaellum component FlaC